MRKKRTTKKNSPARVATVPWVVVDVRVLPRHRLRVTFIDGTEGEIDAAPVIFSRRPGVFERLQDPKEFARAYVDDGVVTWPGGLDMAPDAMYDDIVAAGSRATR
jgi:hypothetical protein